MHKDNIQWAVRMLRDDDPGQYGMEVDVPPPPPKQLADALVIIAPDIDSVVICYLESGCMQS